MIVKEGWIFVIGFSVLGMVCICLIPWIGIWGVVLGGLLFVLGSFNLYFFRDPHRLIQRSDQVILSSGDGVVMNIIKDYELHAHRGTMVQIFLSVFDVHIQRSPVDGVIKEMHYQKGAFLPAMHPNAYQKNEKNILVIENDKGTVVVSQIAGILARRIISWFKKGDSLMMGQKFGIICFGSQVDMLLPGSVSVKVVKGERVKAGITVIGEWS